MLKEIKAENNVLVFESGVYYGITTDDGGTERSWGINVTSAGDKVRVSGSEELYASYHGITLEKLGDWSRFFRSMIRNDASSIGVYLGASKEEVKSRLDQLGFKPGFCTIKVNGKDNTFFYSNLGWAFPKYQYDAVYLGLKQGDNSYRRKPGDTFNFNGNLYPMDEEGHVDVPYGEDVFFEIKEDRPGKAQAGIPAAERKTKI